jgi:hypothetical protein
MRKIHFYFWQGFICYCGLNMALQDWLGLDGYIGFVERNWVNLHWTVGAAFALIALVLHFAARSHEAEIKEDRGKQ